MADQRSPLRVSLYPGPVDTFAIRRYTNELADGLRSLGASVEIHRSERSRRTLIDYASDARRARQQDADLNIICSEGLSYLLLALPPARTAVVCHDVHPILETRMMPRSESMTFRKRLFRIKYRSSLRVLRTRTDAKVVAITAHTADHLSEETGIPRARITVIHNGLASDWAQRPSSESDRIAGIPSDRSVVLHVGNDNWYKNVAGIIEAASLLDRNDVLLVKAGQISDASRRLIEQRGLAQRFLFIPDPTDDELRSLYRRASLLVFPSRHEGFGWPPLEAMAAGCPVVAANTGSLPEVCGDAALYANPTEPHEIARAIASVLDDDVERRRLIELGHHRARQFSWETSAARFLEFHAPPE